MAMTFRWKDGLTQTETPMRRSDAEDQTLPVVRHRRRGGGEVLHVDLPELEDHRCQPLRRRWAAARGNSHAGHVRARRAAVLALNGGPNFTFNEAISLEVVCESQEEVDRYWDALTDGGEAGPCGWLKDRYGVSWQIVPKALYELIGDPDREKSQRAMAAMLKMGKIEIAELERAAPAA
jgi:predicted 3-demethylubiquinone-9 3-methyltransferase (glyoxalase superfamily)